VTPHGRTFWILGIVQYFQSASDERRERFVSLCRDPTSSAAWQAYRKKEQERSDGAPAHHDARLRPPARRRLAPGEAGVNLDGLR
jgi:hypothetical protein